MHFILLDSADDRGSIAVCEGSRLLEVRSHPAGGEFSSWLLPEARRLLLLTGLSLDRLDGYAVCSGPGSFTGLRVGLTTVKAWSEICPKPIAAVSRLEALAGVAGSGNRTLPTAVILDARRGQVFAALYGESGELLEPEAVLALETFVRTTRTRCGSSRILWKTPDPQLLAAVPEWRARQAAGDLLEEVSPPFAAQLAALAERNFRSGQTTDAVALDANYVRRSDAELYWKDHASAVRA